MTVFHAPHVYASRIFIAHSVICFKDLLFDGHPWSKTVVITVNHLQLRQVDLLNHNNPFHSASTIVVVGFWFITCGIWFVRDDDRSRDNESNRLSIVIQRFHISHHKS